ncbi:hypothetical protein, partial [Pontibacterium sp.]|uniref:hypothetical protein n=1 Tax=Pontibacterium sp. TaxID=2036026 RepID=UPI00356696F8
MKFKTALTAEEAALLAVDLERYPDFSAAHEGLQFAHKLSSVEDCTIGPDRMALVIEELMTSIRTAKEIYRALVDDIVLADPLYPPMDNRVTSHLVIASRAQYSEVEDYIVPEKCTVTKSSLAAWFWQHDQDIAKKFAPTITAQSIDVGGGTAVQVRNDPNTKKLNSLLRTVAALSDVVIDGLTGVKNKDAEMVCIVFDQKGKEYPVSKK